MAQCTHKCGTNTFLVANITAQKFALTGHFALSVSARPAAAVLVSQGILVSGDDGLDLVRCTTGKSRATRQLHSLQAEYVLHHENGLKNGTIDVLHWQTL